MKKSRKFLKSTFCLMLSIICLLLCFAVTASASTTTTSGGNTISPSDDELKAAKNPTYSGTSENIAGAISNSYEMDIYHYEAPYDGYYAVYTIGSLDTVGAVYEHQNFLWWTTSDERVAYTDDGSRISSAVNCAMVVYMDKGEDFYICIRAYSHKTGNYNLIIEPNDDKINSTQGGLWNCDHISDSMANSGTYPTKRNYLTKDQALLNYLLLINEVALDEDNNLEIDFELIRETYNEDVDTAISLATTFVKILARKDTVVKVSASILGHMLSGLYGLLTETTEELKTIFEEKCGIQNPEQINGVFYYSAQNGLLKESWYSTFTFNYYYTNNDTLLTGEKYCYGSWN